MPHQQSKVHKPLHTVVPPVTVLLYHRISPDLKTGIGVLGKTGSHLAHMLPKEWHLAAWSLAYSELNTHEVDGLNSVRINNT